MNRRGKHVLAYTSVVLGWIDEPFFALMEKIFKNFAEKVAVQITLPFFNLMVFLKIGHWTYEPDSKDTWRTKCFWDEAKRGDQDCASFLGLVQDGFVAEYKGPRQGGVNKTIVP